MKKNEIRVGGCYLAKVAGVITTVRVDAIHPSDSLSMTRYDVTNLRTGRKTTFRSAAKFRAEVRPEEPTSNQVKEMFEATDRAKLMKEATEEASEESDPTPPTIGACSAASPFTPTASVGSSASTATSPAQAATTEGEQCSDPTEPARSVVGSLGSDEVTAQTLLAGDNAPKLATSLAAKIATARSMREPGTPVAGMIPNEEQESILAAAERIYYQVGGLRVLVVAAGAGTGKTATDKMLEQILPGRGQYTAFNASLVAESKPKFKKAACNTTHSLAFRAVGRLYQHRLGGDRMRSGQVARILGIEPITVLLKEQGEPELDANGKPTGRNLDKAKTLQADFLGGQVLTAIRKFCQSADRQINENHFRYIDGIDAEYEGRRGVANNDKVREYLLHFAQKAWADLSRVDGQLPFSHDCYVKIWQLGTGNDRPIIPADYILLDEAQDTAPVFLDVLKQQDHAMLVFVGDSNQAIYEWRGAVDAMKAYPNAERRLLSQSYRFGQAVADVANAVLATLDEPTDLRMRGMPGLPTRVAPVAAPRCYLYRTNAGAVGRVMSAIAEDKRPHLMGGGADVVAWCEAAIDLQSKHGTRHPELCCFDTWDEVVDYSKTDEGSDLRLMVKLVEEFSAKAIRDALKNMPKEEQADLVVSTAHKSKGREWDTVKLGQDFPLANKMGDADRRLLYVAATRAKLVLDITECPPFCGGNDTRDTGNAETSGAWVPGIPVAYTQPMPSEADLAAYIAGKAAGSPAASRTPPSPLPAPLPPADAPVAVLPAANGNGHSPASYSKLRDGTWGVRATTPIKNGDIITVQTKSGTKRSETVKRVLWSGNGVWLATIQ